MTTTQCRERPILFSGPMVRAILSGKKTQTRRIVKQSYSRGEIFANVQRCQKVEPVEGGWLFYDEIDTSHDQDLACPYGVPGDRLWVREAWAPCIGGKDGPENPILYRADDLPGYDDLTWRPSIHMPRRACRIRLDVTDVRVQRLQEITEEDAIAEGAQCVPDFPASLTDRGAFAKLWNKINGPGAWESNPWVWAVTFKRIDS